jgi:hypothetical protein
MAAEKYSTSEAGRCSYSHARAINIEAVKYLSQDVEEQPWKFST